MNREFLVNILFLIAINLLIKPFYIFFIERDVQNVVGTEAYGIYFTLLNLSLTFHIVNDFGIRNFTSRHIAQHQHLLNKYFPDLLTLKLFLSFAYFMIAMLAGWYLGYWEEYLMLLTVLITSRILIGFIDFFRANIIGLAHYRMDSILSVLHRVFIILFCGLLLWIPDFRANFSINWFVYTEFLSLLLTLIVAFFLLYRHITAFHLQFNYKRTLMLLRQSYPYALIVFLMMIYNRVDAIMIEKLLPDGKNEAGIYAAAYRLLDAGVMFSFLFANLLLPMFARMLKRKENISDLMRFSFQMIMAGVLTGIVASYFFRMEIMDLLYLEATPYWSEILGVLLLSFIAISATHIFGTALLANGSLKALNWLFMAGVFVNILLNLYYIPIYKAYGAAMTTTITQFFVIVGEIILVMHFFRFYALKMWLKIAGFMISFTLLSYLSIQWFPLFWMIHFVLILLMGIGLAFVFRLLEIKPIRMLIMQRKR